MKITKTFLAGLAILSIMLTACGGGTDTDAGSSDAINYDDKTLENFMSGEIENANIACHYSYAVADSELEVIIYISGKKMRLEYMMIPPIQGQDDLTIVSDGEYIYMWGNSFLGQAFGGMKMKLEGEAMEVPKEDMSEVAEFVDFDIPMTECAAWDVDESYFTIPTDVEFMDMSTLEESMMESFGDIENMDVSNMNDINVDDFNMGSVDMSGFAVDCSLCDQMPAGQKESCLESMGCE